jgi:hypothetical protein
VPWVAAKIIRAVASRAPAARSAANNSRRSLTTSSRVAGASPPAISLGVRWPLPLAGGPTLSGFRGRGSGSSAGGKLSLGKLTGGDRASSWRTIYTCSKAREGRLEGKIQAGLAWLCSSVAKDDQHGLLALQSGETP